MRIACIAGALVLAACLGMSPESRRIRDGMIGVEAREVRACIGAPHDLSIEGERELASYEWTWTNAMTGADLRGLDLEPQLMAGGFSSSDHPPGGRCEYSFEFVGGRVDAFSVKGRTQDDLNADATCLSAISHCLPERGEVSPAEP